MVHDELERPLTIYWMTDIHIVDELTDLPDAPDAIRGERHYYAAVRKLSQAVDWINAEQPDLAVCTGDVIDRPQSLKSFVSEWDRIDVPKAFILGNHDLEAGYEAIESQLGHADYPLIAGSRFNQSRRLSNGSVHARLILLDTYVEEDGTHRYDSCEGTITEAAMEWLREQMLQCEEQIILLFAHNGIWGPDEYFDQEAVSAFAKIVDQAVQRGKSFIHLAGHDHVHPEAVVKTIGNSATFINGAAMINGPVSYMNVVQISEDGSFQLDYRKVSY